MVGGGCQRRSHRRTVRFAKRSDGSRRCVAGSTEGRYTSTIRAQTLSRVVSQGCAQLLRHQSVERRQFNFFSPIVKSISMNKLLLVMVVLGLAGCATASKTQLNNGQQGLSIDCSGEAMSWDKCYEKADASCAGTGYNIVGTDGTAQPKESDKTLGVDVGNFKGRTITVVCK